jgi:hypothetical protein
MSQKLGQPKTLYEKIFDSHVVSSNATGNVLLYVGEKSYPTWESISTDLHCQIVI